MSDSLIIRVSFTSAFIAFRQPLLFPLPLFSRFCSYSVNEDETSSKLVHCMYNLVQSRHIHVPDVI